METLLKTFKSYNEADTEKVAVYLYDLLKKNGHHIVLLSGNLGGGKTFLSQKLGKLIGVKDNINSPTFNLMKIYSFRNKELSFNKLVHIDAYRLGEHGDLLEIGLEEYLENEKALLMIEWPKDLKEYLIVNNINFYFIDIEIVSKEERILHLYENKF